MKRIKVNLRPIVSNLNLPTVIKGTQFQGGFERLFIATQVGEIFYIENNNINTFLDIRNRIISLGSSGGYDERGLLGLDFHPNFQYNGLFYLHYSVAGTEGPGAQSNSIKWINREVQYDHIDTVEEWILNVDGHHQKRRTLLNIRRPFMNHNGVNSLNFSPETGKLVLTTGDGGSGYDPFNLSQDDMEIAGKVIEIDVDKSFFNNDKVVTRFYELPLPIQDTLTVIAKGVRNIPGISYQRNDNMFIKYLGNVGQDLVESIYGFVNYHPKQVTRIVNEALISNKQYTEGLINLGWRGWEGIFPTTIRKNCNSSINELVLTFYDEAVITAVQHLEPIISYFHDDTRPDRISGTALTGVKPYMGRDIPELTGSIVFTDLANRGNNLIRGVLGYSKINVFSKLNDYGIIEPNYDFGNKSAYYVSLGTNDKQTKLYLGVYSSMKVTEPNLGAVYEIIP